MFAGDDDDDDVSRGDSRFLDKLEEMKTDKRLGNVMLQTSCVGGKFNPSGFK